MFCDWIVSILWVNPIQVFLNAEQFKNKEASAPQSVYFFHCNYNFTK